MDARTTGLLSRALAGSLAAILMLPTGIDAQQSRDFFFGRPDASIGFRAGFALPRAGSDVFDFTQDVLTLDEGDLRSGSIGVELSVPVSDQLAVALTLSHARTETRSEYRDFIEDNGLPIEQTREFSRTPLTLSLKGYLWERGRSVGRFAWIPRTWAPYVGAGGGVMWYRYALDGDFVDFETLEIFSDTLLSEGATSTFHVLAGVEFSLSRRALLTAEARYAWASTEMDLDFQGFDEIDLAGLDASVGIALRF